MTTAGPWSVKGIDPKARELAKDLARRSGMTLGEWLNQMIIEGDGEEAEYEAPPQAPSFQTPPRTAIRDIRLSSDAELKRVARALDALTARMEAAENRSTLAISGIDQSVMGVLSRIEGVERDRGSIAGRFDAQIDEVKAAQEKVADRLRRMADDEAPRLDAMRALEGALGKIAEKLYDSDAKTKAALDDVRQDVAHAVRRVDRVESRVEAEPAANLVEAVVARIGDRLAEAESRTANAMKALEASFAGLDARLATTEAAGDENSPERRFERLALELSEKVDANRAELTERLSAVADGKLDRMEATLRELAGHVEQGERRSAQAIDRMGREVMRIATTLGDRVATVESRNAEATQQMGSEMARIADAMEHRMGHVDNAQAEALEKLGGEIARIAEKLADRIANAERRSAAAIDDVGEQLGRVTERLNDRYEASQGALADRIRASEERTAKLLEDARETIDRRLGEVRRAPVEAHPHPLYAEIEPAEFTAAHPAPSPFGDDDPFAVLERPDPTPAAPTAEALFGHAAGDEPFENRYAGFAADGAAAESFHSPAPAPAPPITQTAGLPPLPPKAEPLSTRDVVAAARAAAREASEKAESGRRRETVARPMTDIAGSMAAPPIEMEAEGARSTFSFGAKRKKKDSGLTLRTMVVASGTAAALAVTAVGATLYLGAETGNGGDHVDRSSPPPTAARADDKALAAQAVTPPAPAPVVTPEGTGLSAPADAAAKPEMLAMAVAPLPGETGGLRPPPVAKKAATALIPTTAAPSPTSTPAKGPLEARPLYNTAIGRLQSGDVAGVEDLRKAANLGFAPAQFYLAKLYETGGSGIKKDLSEARRWTQRAAEAGDPRAMHNLALYQFNGEGGTKDQGEAARWFKKAADQGVVDSQYNLARLYETGAKDAATGTTAVAQNKAEAYRWYLVAAAEGDHDAKASAEALKAQLTPDQVAAAARAAQAFHPQKVETAKAQ